MANVRGMRSEDLNAEALTMALATAGEAVRADLRKKILTWPQVVQQRRAARTISPVDWNRYIDLLVAKALSGQDALRSVNEFNERYVFPHRRKQLG